MPKIYKKIVHACGHCPAFESQMIYDIKAKPSHVRNTCREASLIVKDSLDIPDWCPLPDGEE